MIRPPSQPGATPSGGAQKRWSGPGSDEVVLEVIGHEGGRPTGGVAMSPTTGRLEFQHVTRCQFEDRFWILHLQTVQQDSTRAPVEPAALTTGRVAHVLGAKRNLYRVDTVPAECEALGQTSPVHPRSSGPRNELLRQDLER